MIRETNNTIYKRDDIITDSADMKIIIREKFSEHLYTNNSNNLVKWIHFLRDTHYQSSHTRDSQILCCFLKTYICH